MAAVDELQPLAFGAGVGALGFIGLLVRLLLKNVSSQGGSWEGLNAVLVTDAKDVRSEMAKERAERSLERAGYRADLAERDAVIDAFRIEVGDLKQQLRDRGPLP